MFNKKTQPKNKQSINKNTLESLVNIGGGVMGSFAQDVVKDSFTGFFDQILKGGQEEQKNKHDAKGDLVEGQELELSTTSSKSLEKPPRLDIEPGMDYRREILHAEKRVQQENTQELSVKIQEIIIELKQLMNVSQELKVEFKQIATEQKIVNPGKYHVSFFEWVLLLVRQARMKVEDSSAWVAAFKSKKAKKQYWSMFKKHGTTFGLSNERVVSTQTG